MTTYFPKFMELDELSPNGEPSIQIVRLHEFNKLAHVKTSSEALDYIRDVKPIPGKTVILVLAMTAGEYYGPNRNGDSWSEKPLKVGKSVITEDDVLPKHYKTFETNANCYAHHINKDPEKKIGDVLKAFYNWPMHRVELLLALDNNKARDTVQQIEEGKFPCVSMGCKILADVCSICGNKAPSRAQYCDHAKYNLGDMLSNGKRIFVWNPSPKFFDISIVRRPADRLGFMMKKVAEAVPEIRSGAELGEYIDQASKKVAALRKLSIIHKILSGQIGAIKDDSGEVKELKQLSDQVARPAAAAMPEIDDATIRSLIQYRPAQVLSTLAEMGITLTTPEFLKYFAWQVDPAMPIPEDAIERAIASQQKIFGMLAEHPELLDEIEETGYLDMSPENFNPQIAEKLQPLVEKRSQHRDWIVKRGYVEQPGFRPREFGEYRPGDYTTVTMQDPNTSKVYQTTQSAINRAHGVAQKQRWGNILGGGALLAGGMAMLPFRGARMLSPLLFGPGAYQMFKGVKGQPHVMSDAGPIYQRVEPQNSPLSTFYQPGFEGTELVEKQSSFEHLDVPNAMIRLAMDMQHHPGSKNRRVAPISVEADHASFDEVVEKIGAAIYL